MTIGFYVSYVALWLLVMLQTLVLVGLVRSVHGSGQRVPRGITEDTGLPSGHPVPPFAITDVNGQTIDSAGLTGHSTALLFVSPECTTCAVTLDELEALKHKTAGHAIVFCRGQEDACRVLVDRYRLRVPVVVDNDFRMSELLHITSTPTAVLVDERGNVSTYGHPMTSGDLEALFASEASGSQTTESRTGLTPDDKTIPIVSVGRPTDESKDGKSGDR